MSKKRQEDGAGSGQVSPQDNEPTGLSQEDGVTKSASYQSYSIVDEAPVAFVERISLKQQKSLKVHKEAPPVEIAEFSSSAEGPFARNALSTKHKAHSSKSRSPGQ
ncbi:MAG: hypothetical protein K0R63_1655 [Rickettsiales bacterium]|jgi:hypothetical protein|nr:hypothetical protein [Rickettsiales bacterium]